MAFVYACELPEDIWFDVERDVWLRAGSDGVFQVGMTDPAQTRAGKILQIRVRAGKQVSQGRSVATVESGKWVGPIPAPVSAFVVEGNPDVIQDPNLINRDPYGRGWILTIRPDRPPDGWREMGLFYGSEAVQPYRLKLREEGLSCLRCAEPTDE